MNLICDRTEADIEHWKQLQAKGYANLTAGERGEWDAGLRGAYNASDMNRVESAVTALAASLNAAGYSVMVTTKTDWALTDIPTPTDMQRYLDNVSAIRSALIILTTTPVAPTTMDGLLWSTANDIEKILADVDWLIDQMKANVNAGWAIGTSHTGLYAANPTVKLLSESGAILVDDLENAPDLLTLPDGNGSTVLVESGGANYLYEVT